MHRMGKWKQRSNMVLLYIFDEPNQSSEYLRALLLAGLEKRSHLSSLDMHARLEAQYIKIFNGRYVCFSARICKARLADGFLRGFAQNLRPLHIFPNARTAHEGTSAKRVKDMNISHSMSWRFYCYIRRYSYLWLSQHWGKEKWHGYDLEKVKLIYVPMTHDVFLPL